MKKKLIALCTLGPLSLAVAAQALLREQPTVAAPAPAVEAPVRTAVPGPAAPEGPRLEREGLAIQFDLWPAVGASAEVTARQAHRVELEPRFDASVRRKAGEEHALRFRLADSGSGKPVSAEEITVLLFRSPGAWQWRGSPRAVGEGEFEVTFRPPGPGQFKFLVGVESRGAPLGSFWPVTLGVVEGTSAKAAPRLAGGHIP